MKRETPRETTLKESLHRVTLEVDAGGMSNLRAGATARVVLRFFDSEGEPREASPRLEIIGRQARTVMPQEESTGVYSYALTLRAGSYRLRASSIGTAPTVAEKLIFVR